MTFKGKTMYCVTWTNEDDVGNILEEIEIALDFDFDPGQKEIIYADADRCQEGIRSSATVTFAKRLDTGAKIPLSAFTKKQIERWEEDYLIEKNERKCEMYKDWSYNDF